MSDLTFIEKAKLEKIFGMSGGYVLSFSDRTFAEFIKDSTGKDICDAKYQYASGSKANRLRAFWKVEPNEIIGKLILDLLAYRRFSQAGSDNDSSDTDTTDAGQIVERLCKKDAAANGPAQRSQPVTFTAEDRKFAELAIVEARKSLSEDDRRPHPKVGAVVVRDGKVLGVAHRGEISGCHAEYIALECKLADTFLTGATVYTTLEPCTERNHPKVPCAHRLVEWKVRRVVIGMLDPNPVITGRGQLILREANIITDLFPHDLMSEAEELNRDFKRMHRTAATGSESKSAPAKPPLSSQPIVPVAHSDQARFSPGVDRATLEDLLRILPSAGAIHFLRTNNFAGFSFDWKNLNELNHFIFERSGPDHEFIDPQLEALRQDLLKKSRIFMGYLSLNTFSIGTPGAHFSSVPSEWESEQPERFGRVVDMIHTQAQDVCDSYDQLIRTARKKVLT